MTNTELKSVGEMCDEIKSLKAENKSLKATNKSFRERFEEESSDEETSEEFERGYETCKNDMFDQYDAAVNPLKAEIKSLKEEKKNDDRCFWELNEEAEKLKEQAEDAFQAIAEALCGEGEDAGGHGPLAALDHHAQACGQNAVAGAVSIRGDGWNPGHRDHLQHHLRLVCMKGTLP